jgi:cytoskeletal protein RodZ
LARRGGSCFAARKQKVMLGDRLRQAREARGAPLHEVEWATKIKGAYLEALEEENFRLIPGAVYVRGFLRTYANYLGIDPEPLIDEYNQADETSGEIISTRSAVLADKRQLVVTPAMIVGVALILLLGVFGLYVKTQFDRYQASLAATSQATPHPNILSPAPSPVALPTPTPSPPPAPKVSAALQLVLKVVNGPAWIRVDIDGKPSTETDVGKIYQPGAVLTFNGNQTVRVISGRASNTSITLNGKDQPLQGGNGGVVDKTFTKA